MANNPPTGSISRWQPGAGGTSPNKKNPALANTTASENADCVTGTNPLTPFVGTQKAKPSGPFGVQGQEF